MGVAGGGDVARVEESGKNAAMELKDLNADERLALVALARAVVGADGAVSAKETERVEIIAAEIGREAYHAAFDEAARAFTDKSKLQSFLLTITRPEARELISDTILDLAIGDALAPAEVRLLKWLEATWKTGHDETE
jgi:uncharacterized tellurite resistance protein B-like protein